MEKLHRKYAFAPADKAANNVIIIWKRHYVEVLKGELNSTGTYVPAQLTKDQLLVHHINTLTKINVKIEKCELPTFYWLPNLHKCPYQPRFISNSSHYSTAIFSKHITSALTAVKIMLWSTVKLLLAIVMSIIFDPLKTLQRSSKSCDCVTFRILKYFLSTFLLYTPHCHMILSKQKCCLWSTVFFNRESKSYLCTSLKAGCFSNKKYYSYRCWSCAELCEAFTFLMENIYVQFDGMVY